LSESQGVSIGVDEVRDVRSTTGEGELEGILGGAGGLCCGCKDGLGINPSRYPMTLSKSAAI